MSKGSDWNAENLEKAAKYMRELDKSSNSRAAIELARREQDVEIAREKTRSAEFEMQRAQVANQLERTRAEEARKLAEHRAQIEQASRRRGAEMLRTRARRRTAPLGACGPARDSLQG